MTYTAYESYIDFLFSQEAKERDPYLDFRVDIVSSGAVSSYKPADGSYVIPSDRIQTIAMTTMSPSARMDWQAGLLEENNGQYAETDLTYDEVFNEPASGKIDQCKYAEPFARKARWDAIVKHYAAGVAKSETVVEAEDEGEGSAGGMGPRLSAGTGSQSQRRNYGHTQAEVDRAVKKAEDDYYEMPSNWIESLANEYPFKDRYDEQEYDKYGIPLTFLNGEEAAVTAKNWSILGDDLTVSVGALVSIDRPETSEVIPVGYIDFEGASVCNSYELQFDPTGLLKLK